MRFNQIFYLLLSPDEMNQLENTKKRDELRPNVCHEPPMKALRWCTQIENITVNNQKSAKRTK